MCFFLLGFLLLIIGDTTKVVILEVVSKSNQAKKPDEELEREAGLRGACRAAYGRDVIVAHIYFNIDAYRLEDSYLPIGVRRTLTILPGWAASCTCWTRRSTAR